MIEGDEKEVERVVGRLVMLAKQANKDGYSDLEYEYLIKAKDNLSAGLDLDPVPVLTRRDPIPGGVDDAEQGDVTAAFRPAAGGCDFHTAK